MIILLNDILPSKTSQRKFSSVLEPYAVKVASTVLRGECYREVMFLPDNIVLKADQRTNKLTQGIVKDVLTNSPSHPHGIKVRLQEIL